LVFLDKFGVDQAGFALVVPGLFCAGFSFRVIRRFDNIPKSCDSLRQERSHSTRTDSHVLRIASSLRETFEESASGKFLW